MKLMYFVPFCLSFFLASFCHSFAQLSQECQAEDWPAIIGPIVGPTDDCEYEVEDWEETNMLVMTMPSLEAHASPVRSFEMVGFLNNLYLKTTAGFRFLELRSGLDEVIAAVELDWVTDESGITTLQVRGFASIQTSPFLEPTWVEFAYVEPVQDGSPLHFRLVWKVSSPDVREEWLELSVNEAPAGRIDLVIPQTGPDAPAHIRYGYTLVADILPQGTFSFRPIHPTPNAPHL